jgi:hypothetical protein
MAVIKNSGLITIVILGVIVIGLTVVITHRHKVAMTMHETIPTTAGKSEVETVYSTTRAGTTTMCQGHEVAPGATGCTASGGVVFASPPQRLGRTTQNQ